MIRGQRIVVVMPAYNAARTVERTVSEIDTSVVDDIILVDDCSADQTVAVARRLGIRVIQHEENLGYGGNQKTCYNAALNSGADIVIMLHPDYQYTPALVPAMAAMLAEDVFDVVLGSRILSGGALRGGMPVYKYIANRFLTLVQNLFTGMKLSEYHTGYRAYRRCVLESVPFSLNSNDFIFDNQILLQAALAGFRIAELTCPTRYFPEASSINLRRSMTYGLGCLWNSLLFRLATCRIYTPGFLTLHRGK